VKTSLIIGMGIGNLYATVLDKLGHTVITVDSNPDKHADFLTVEDAIKKYQLFDTVHICTPNFTHIGIARKLAAISKIVFIEKPGVATADAWQQLVKDYANTRFMMVKNNMWRDNINALREQATRAKLVNIEWTRRNCIPSPGSWFTTRELAFGGVSRDLMPHLLSLYIALNDDWHKNTVIQQASIQQWQLENIESTEYGTINANGVYNVDDKCTISFGSKWNLVANWRSMDYEKSAIEFTMQDDSVETFELGWCPESAYQTMITDAIANKDNNAYWQQQFDQDIWIHQKIENI